MIRDSEEGDTMSNVSEAASEVMWHLVTHSAHGYSQPNRHGTGGPNTGDYSAPGGEVIDVPNWGKVRIHSGDYDCSEAAIDCYGFLGIPVGGATYTGNERQGLTSTWLFTAYPAGSVTPKDGDILLRDGHTEMVINGGRWQAGFRRSENHSITGRTGDQDGGESTYSPLDMSRWTWIIRYTGPDKTGPAQAEPAPKPATQPKPADTAEKVEAIMASTAALITPTHDGKPLGYVAFWDGHELRGLDNADQVPAIQKVYAQMGQTVPSFTMDDNWFYRFATAVSCNDSAIMAKVREFFPNEGR